MNTQSALCSDQGRTCSIDQSQEGSASKGQANLSRLIKQWSPKLTDIQRVSGLAWNPAGIEEDELLDQLGQLFTVKRGQCNPGGGLSEDQIKVKPNVSFSGRRHLCNVRTKTDPVHPVHVHIRSEESDGPIFASVSLHPFEPK